MMQEPGKVLILTGRTLAPGLAEGKTFAHPDVLTQLDESYDIDDSQVATELKRLEGAVAEILDDLNALAARVKKDIDSDLSGVFHAHMAMLQDPILWGEVERQIREELVSAGAAVRTVFRRWERRFRSMGSEVSRQKGDDVRDVARRLILSLAGIGSHTLEDLPAGSVLVASRLLPSDTVCLARREASAALLEFGGPGSHAALFAREIGLPCVSGLTGLLEEVESNALALVDADAARVILNPDQKQRMVFQAKCRQEQENRSRARAQAQQPAYTRDGTRIAVLANVGHAQDTQEAIQNGADGVGLYRIEQAYLGRQKPPDTAALVEELRETLKPAGGRPVCVRLLDVGADKPLPFVQSLNETNPSLGRRGIRFLREYPDLFRTQFDALLHLSSELDLSILVPMVTLARDMEKAREVLTDCVSAFGEVSVPRLGAMIETPAAALSVREITRHAEFLSFGTNDLTQYTFAADRENEAVDEYFDDSHEVIFRLLKTAHEDVPEIPLSICGELASRPEHVSRLLQCGIRTLSVAPPSVPLIKEAVRRCRLDSPCG